MIVSKDRRALTAERHQSRGTARRTERPTGGIGLPRRCYRPLAVDGGAPGSKIGGRIRNSWVPGGGLDPLTPNSMRRGDTSCGTVLAGGWRLGILSDRGRRVLECAFEFGASGLHTNQHGKSERRSRQVKTAQLVHHGSLRDVEPPVHTWGFDQIPFGTTGASLSGLNAGDYSSPAPTL